MKKYRITKRKDGSYIIHQRILLFFWMKLDSKGDWLSEWFCTYTSFSDAEQKVKAFLNNKIQHWYY